MLHASPPLRPIISWSKRRALGLCHSFFGCDLVTRKISRIATSQGIEHDLLMAKNFSHLKITSEKVFAPAQDFALSILKNRKLAQYVRHVSLDYHPYGGFPAQALSYKITTEAELEKEASFKAAITEQKWNKADATELLKRLMTTSPSDPELIEPSSHELFPDAVVALLLPILPNVQKLTVSTIGQPSYVEKAIQRAKDEIFGSISVTHVEILAVDVYNEREWADCDFPAFKIFPNLPSLKRISGEGIGGIGIEDGGTYYDIPSKASAVREIDLRDCELSGHCLSTIINFSTGLEVFTYRFGGRRSGDGTGIVFTPELAKALTPHRLMMRSLDIDSDGLSYQSLEADFEGFAAMLESDDLHKLNAFPFEPIDNKANVERWAEEMKSDPYFPNLTHLRIGIKLASRFAVLSGKKTLAEWLPAGLEELELVGYDPDESPFMNDEVTEVVQQREKLLPKLKVLKGVEEYIENGFELADEEDS